MPNVPVPVVGPTYTSQSLPVSAQVTRGFYIEKNESSENPYNLSPFPGLTLFTTAGTKNRGLGVYNGELYAVSDSSLYKIAVDATVTNIGGVTGATRCILKEDLSNLVITTGVSKPYSYDGTTLTLGTDTDLPNAATVTYIKNRVVYDGSGANVAFADLGAPLSVNSANITSADSTAGDVQAVIAFNDQLFVFKKDSIIPYYNIGTGNPPYRPIQNSTNTKLGLKAIHSLSFNYRSLYFLGSDLMVYRIGGLQAEPIGNGSIGQAIRGYSNPDQAWGVCLEFDNQYFYMLTFPNHATWLFNEGAGWTNLAYGTEGAPHLIYDYVKCYDKHLVSDRRNGNIYELDFSNYTDNGDSIDKQRDTIKISGKELGFPGKEIVMNRLELVVETGVGLISGQGSDPRIMMSYSDDGGRTWSSEQWSYLGVMGSFTYSQNPSWTDLGSFHERMFRFRVSDPVKVVIISANADIEVCV